MTFDVPGGYVITDDRAEIDVAAAWDLLQREAYWGHFRDAEMFARQVASSWRVVAALHVAGGGALVGFARAVADGEALGYLADVVVEPAHRGRGVGPALVHELVETGEAASWRWMLHTRDAHTLYARFGFAPPDGTYLERPRRQQ